MNLNHIGHAHIVPRHDGTIFHLIVHLSTCVLQANYVIHILGTSIFLTKLNLGFLNYLNHCRPASSNHHAPVTDPCQYLPK